MATTGTLSLSLTLDDGIGGNTPLVKLYSVAFVGSGHTYFPQQLVGVDAPAAPSPTASSGGSMGAGNYLFLSTYVDAPQGETNPGAESTTVAVPSSGKVIIPSPPPRSPAQYWNAYGTQAGGSTGTEKKLNTNPIPIGTNWTQTAAITGSGASLPTDNTTLVWTPTFPAITPVQLVWIHNYGGGAVRVHWTPQALSPTDVLDIMPNSAKAFGEASAGSGIGGITALVLTVLASQTSLDLVLLAQ